MHRNKEIQIRTFVQNQLNDAPDLSALTLGILKRKYLSHVGDWLTRSGGGRSELKSALINGTDVRESENAHVVPSSNKRKRGEEDEASTGSSVDEDESRAKKIRRRSSSSGRSSAGKSKDVELKGKSCESKEEQVDQNGDEDQWPVQGDGGKESKEDQDSTEEQMDISDKPQNGKKPAGDNLNDKQKVGKRGSKPGSGKQQTKVSGDEEKESSSSLSDLKDSKKENTPKEDGVNSEDTDSDKDAQDSLSSSQPSLEDDEDGGEDSAPAKKLTKEKGDKKKRKEDDSKKEKVSDKEDEDEKAVLRLKRYISLCGVKRNYKKLLEGCRTIRSKVAVLKKELEELGIQGQPSIEKCKKARLKREEAQELAELDVSNIITTQGRPKRRGASAWQEPQASLAARYKRTVDSDSEEGGPTGRGPKRSTDWSHLQGIISDDGDSD
ncbi:unnamed protein product [Merluccius merluccius]